MGDIYIGVNGIARKANKIYVGVNGVARQVQKIYVGDPNGIARQVYSAYDPNLPDVTIPNVSGNYEPQNYTAFMFNKAKYLEAVANGYTKLAFHWNVSVYRNADTTNYLQVGTPMRYDTIWTKSGFDVNVHGYAGDTTIDNTALAQWFSNSNYTNAYFLLHLGYGAGDNDFRNIKLTNVRFTQ